MRFKQINIKRDLIGACNDRQEYYVGSFNDKQIGFNWSVFGTFNKHTWNEYTQLDLESLQDEVQEQIKKLPGFDKYFTSFIIEETADLITDGYFDTLINITPTKSLEEIVEQLNREMQSL